jgi:type IV pilus assembly protein PilV
MEQSVYLNKAGFTLIEFLVAIVIMMVGILALLETVNVALKLNLANQLRNEAVMIADGKMALEMTKPFALISTNATPNTTPITRNVNNAVKTFTVTKAGTLITNTAKSVDVSVSWSYKNTPYTHSVQSLISAYGQ